MSRFQIERDQDTLKEVLRGEVEKPLKELTADGKTEKHVPFIIEKEDGYLVKVGEDMKHPMQEDHFIEFIELIIDDTRLHRVYLTPTDEPEAYFKVEKGTKVVAREYCNLHGLWKNL